MSTRREDSNCGKGLVERRGKGGATDEYGAGLDEEPS